MENKDLSVREEDNHILHTKFVIKFFINIVIEKH